MAAAREERKVRSRHESAWDLVVQRAVASGDPETIEAALGLRDMFAELTDAGHARIEQDGPRGFRIVPLTDFGREMLHGSEAA